MERIELLRSEALEYPHCGDELLYLFHKRYIESEINSEFLKYADAFDFAFSELTPNISDGELIVGKFSRGLTDRKKSEWENLYRKTAEERIALSGGGQDSHMAIDYELLLSKGIRGIISKIDESMESCSKDALDFYSAAKICLLAVVKHADNYAALAESLARSEQNALRKSELLKIASICKKVPAEPASSFYEAVQSVHFVTYCLTYNPLRRWTQQFQLGHPDRYLISYYRKDISEGLITEDEAQLLLDCLGIQINLRVPRGLSSGYMVGGRDENGEIVANELTEMLMQVIDDIRLVYPSVGFCYTKDMPDGLLKKACAILMHGRSHPAIFNDDVITKGLISYGVPEREARNYIHSTCVEITPVASSNVWVASPYTNMVQILLDTMTCEYASFEDHLNEIFRKLDCIIEKNFIAENDSRKHRAVHSMNPLLSCFVNDCLASGVDIERGGARYNWIMPSFVGMANLVDSLYVLKRIVYEQKKYTVCELKKILDNNFRGNEALRSYALYELPKY